MEIVNNKALRVRTRTPERYSAVLPKSYDEGECSPGVHSMLVHWGYDESLVLKNLGVRGVPSPISRDYKWPGVYTPMAHQRETAEFLSLHHRAFCFDEMGLGKSMATAWAADYLMQLGRVTRALVICPVSIMEAAWRQDLFRSVMHRTVGIAHGSRTKRQKVIASDCEFCIINYDGVPTVFEELRAAAFDLIIMDEANMIKNAQAARSKMIGRLIGPETRVWLLTGSPAAQSPEDAYGLAKMVAPERVPKFLGAWRDKVMMQVSAYRWVPRARAKEIVHAALQPAIRHTAKECLDLPAITYVDRVVPLTQSQMKYYKQLKAEMVVAAAGQEITAVNGAALLSKMLQLSCGALYTDDGNTVEFDGSPRLSALDEIINESAHKIIVFVPFRHTIALLERHFAARGVTYEVISGDVGAGKRGAIFERFQTAEDPKVIIIQPQSAAHGVTLTAASTVVWYGPVTSLDTYIQANARAHRKGQKNKVVVVHMQGSEAEAKLYKALQVRGSDHIDLMELYKELVDS